VAAEQHAMSVAFWRKRHALLCRTDVPQHPLGDGRHRVDARVGCCSEAHRSGDTIATDVLFGNGTTGDVRHRIG
jgi:hypothetical protein